MRTTALALSPHVPFHSLGGMSWKRQNIYHGNMAWRTQKQTSQQTSQETQDLIWNAPQQENFDDILAQIDAVLETNAEEFVRSFVQKGGQ